MFTLTAEVCPPWEVHNYSGSLSHAIAAIRKVIKPDTAPESVRSFMEDEGKSLLPDAFAESGYCKRDIWAEIESILWQHEHVPGLSLEIFMETGKGCLTMHEPSLAA